MSETQSLLYALVLFLYLVCTTVWTRFCLDYSRRHNKRATFIAFVVGVLVLLGATAAVLIWLVNVAVI